MLSHLLPEDNQKSWIEEIVPIIPILSDSARGVGFANVKTDPDHVVRKMPMIIKFEKYYYPGIDLILVMHYFNITKEDVEIKIGKYIQGLESYIDERFGIELISSNQKIKKLKKD